MICKKKLGQIVVSSLLMFSWLGCGSVGKSSNEETKIGNKEKNKGGTKEEDKSKTTTSDVLPLGADKVKILKGLGDTPIKELTADDQKKLQAIYFEYMAANLSHANYEKYVSAFCSFTMEPGSDEEQCKKHIENCKEKFKTISKDELSKKFKANEQEIKGRVANSAGEILMAIEFAGFVFEKIYKLGCPYKEDELFDAIKRELTSKSNITEEEKIKQIVGLSCVVLFGPFFVKDNPS